MKNPDPDPNPNPEPDSGHDKDDARAIAPAPTGGALASLKALELALSGVDTSSVAGRSGLPMLQFKREGSGTWMFGQKKTVVEAGSHWAVNPSTFKQGYICFNDANKPAGEHLAPVSQPMPEVTTLPDKGFPWQEQWAVNMKCVDGTDAGIEVVFKTATDGGIKAVVELINKVRDRLNGGEHGGNVVPIVQLEKDSYPHPEHGRTWIPVFNIVDWMSLGGPAPAPAPASPPPPAEQPRRRRVA
jgi:hypothetical protein